MAEPSNLSPPPNTPSSPSLLILVKTAMRPRVFFRKVNYLLKTS
ncbi:MAG: hypothetical protein QXW47_06935 [Candidatus Jordarchaeales archaeon]